MNRDTPYHWQNQKIQSEEQIKKKCSDVSNAIIIWMGNKVIVDKLKFTQ